MKNLPINEILQGDCLELLKKIPSNSIDCVFADPPFNLRKKYNSHKDKLLESEYLQWCEKWIDECVRVLKNDGFIFLHNIPKWLISYANFLNYRAIFKHWISWEAMTAPMGKTLQPAHYGILFYAKGEVKDRFREIRYPHKRDRKGVLVKDYGGKKSILHPFGPLCSDIWTDIHRIRHAKNRDNHPCQLPIHLLERIILMSSKEGDIILDPFLGTGTTALAAKRLGRKFIGFEKDEQYCQIAREKIESESFISKVGEFYVSFHLNEIITLRECDWEGLKKYFEIPQNIKEIDMRKIRLKVFGENNTQKLDIFDFLLNEA
ncbi:site-specific DNA-methyltransferase [Campylobacter sp. MIT 21-1685]|uniref:DNA-methyltransferase n=1 Tax=unclassified Campylobacter TaxID=2593542 RepID=UPI00224B80A8|nr:MULTISPECIES: site-specific DNA-methyltransferase [unclassified Campylobacter]MCX2683703.1 site-specific DNA-methyltransferase [Campylobacter sp. MIT 21-1684]MCX2751988.1 site-specific DNA-methyltransferase [Campylobacter sp. MIT 21-1682]MCX2808187.1 site-specific DNA-methyltransferase [Campylobacter sp. MIT 21-1685]